MPEKLSFELVREKFKERGYVLFDSEYKNNRTKMRYRCQKHPEKDTSISYSDLKSGKGCKYCRNDWTSERQLLPFSVVEAEFKKRGYQLLDTVYVGNKTPMRYVCPNHPDIVSRISYDNLRGGHGCSKCRCDSISGSNHYKWKGGISSLNGYLRMRLEKWKMDALKEHDYKCFVTGESGTLEIHHLKPFNVIRDDVLLGMGLHFEQCISSYTQEQLEAVAEKVVAEHEALNGIPLKPQVHKLFHSTFGYSKETTIDDLLTFKNEFLLKNGRLVA